MMATNIELSEIQYFYKNSTVFLTGATGFVGKVLLEKFLRTLHVKHVYVLVRRKKDVDAEARCADIFDSPAFDNLRRKDAEFFKKVSLIVGDCEQPDLGLRDNDKQLIIKEVNWIFHCAATTTLDQGLKEATLVNVRATRDLLNIAKQVENLKSLVYISTAFSNFPKFEIHENFYEPTITAEKLINIVENTGDSISNETQTKLLGEWPNTYTFTKCVAEDLIKREGKDIGACIIRASHIISAAEEPVAGYVENIASLAGLAVANALGINRMNYYKNGTLDVIPVDYVVSLMIAAGWYTGLQMLRKKRGDIGCNDVVLYHCISSQEKPVSSDEWFGLTYTACREVPSTRIIRLPGVFSTACYYNFIIFTFIFHTCLGFLCDLGMNLLGKKAMVVDGFKKLHNFQIAMSAYLLKQWYFSNENTQKLLKRMSFRDRELFNFDITKLNLECYFVSFARGLRVYILKDPMSTLAEGRKLLKKKLIGQFISSAVVLVILYVVSKYVLFRMVL